MSKYAAPGPDLLEISRAKDGYYWTHRNAQGDAFDFGREHSKADAVASGQCKYPGTRLVDLSEVST